jgi:NAD(P)-dependent dehydrogenase (short-subunit alcohol dehydrogenase family)
MGPLRFDGRVAIVTGAGGEPGLGRSYARLLAERGAKVLVNDLGVGPDGRAGLPAHAEAVAGEIVAAGGEAIPDLHSVADPAGAEAIVGAALAHWGRLDILINNAGVNIPALFGEISNADIERTIGVHLMGTIWMCRAAWPHMTSARYGRIINTGSPTFQGLRHYAIYGAAKGGVFSLTRALAIEGASAGIVVKTVIPSALTASAVFMSAAERRTDLADPQASPDGVAPTVAFLAHERCAFSGKTIRAARGRVAELFLSQTAGYTDPGHAIDDVPANLVAVLDRDAAEPIADPIEASQSVPASFRPKPYAA